MPASSHPIHRPRVLEVFATDASFTAEFKLFNVDAVAMGTKKHKCQLRAPVFPLHGISTSNNMAESLAADDHTALVVIHIPSVRSQEWTSFLDRLWDLCCALTRPAIAILALHDAWSECCQTRHMHSSYLLKEVVAHGGFQPSNPCFRRKLLTCHLPGDIPSFVQFPQTVTYAKLDLQQGLLPRFWVASLVSHVSLMLHFDHASMNQSALDRVGAQKQSKRSATGPLLSEFRHVVTVPSGPSWTVRQEVSIPEGKGKILELRAMSNGGDGAQSNDICAKVGVWRSPTEFLEESTQLEHPFDLHPSVPDHVRRSIFARLTEGCVEFARSQLVSLHAMRDLQSKLDIQETQLVKGLHPQVKKVLRDKPISLFRQLCRDAGWRDDGLADDMASGFPLVGELKKPGLFEKRTIPGSLNPQELKSQSTWLRRSAVGSCRSSGDPWVDDELWKTVMKDVSEGWASGPYYSEAEVTDFLDGDQCWIVSRRFPVVQDSGAKVRGIDDMSASLVNSTVTSYEKIIPGSSDRVASLVAFMSRAANNPTIQVPLLSGELLSGQRHADFESEDSRRILGTTIDLSSAYRQLAFDPDHQWACVLVAYDPHRQAPAFIVLHALPFGASAAVEAFLRTSLALKAIGQSVCHLAWECFFDDFPLVEYAPLAGTSRTSALALFKRLGWTVSTDKLKPSSESFSALGVVFDCAATPLDLLGIRNKEGRVDEICDLIKSALADRSLSTPQLQKLRGKLAFASQQTSGRWPSLLLSTLSLRGRDGDDSCLYGDPFPVLQWFVEHLHDVPPRVIRLIPGGAPWIIFSDGAVEDDHSSLGFILVDSVKKLMWWSKGIVPDSWLWSWHRRGVTHPICEVEMLAVLCAYNTWGPLIRGSRCLAFIDNNSCLDALIRNRTDSDAMRPLLCSFAELDFQYQVMWWFSRVPSHSNSADLPSRMIEPVAPQGWTAVEWQVRWPECRDDPDS